MNAASVSVFAGLFGERAQLEKRHAETPMAPSLLGAVPPAAMSEPIRDWTKLASDPSYRYEA